MENSKGNQKPILVKIANQLLKDQQELDSLAVQVSLGKAEARDKFREVKSELKEKIQDFKKLLSSEYNKTTDWVKNTLEELDRLESTLEESIEEDFEASKVNIIEKIDNVKELLAENPQAEKLLLMFSTYYEKSKLQLEVLEQSAQDKKAELTESYRHNMEEAGKSATALIEKFNDKKEEAEIRVEIFKEEIDLVYQHLKRAVKAFS